MYEYVFDLKNFLIIFSLLYVYFAFALGSLALRYGYRFHWIAWIPIINFFLFPIIAKKKWYYGFIFLIPVISWILFATQEIAYNIIAIFGVSITAAFFIYLLWIICERRNIHGAYSLIALGVFPIFPAIFIISLFGVLVLLGILAWGKEKNIFDIERELKKIEKIKTKKTKKSTKKKNASKKKSSKKKTAKNRSSKKLTKKKAK